MPRLLNDILGSLFADDAGVALLSCPPGATSLSGAAAMTDPDVVIAAEHDAGPSEVSSLLQRSPQVRVLTVTDNGRSGILYELRPHRRTIGELSADAVRSTIRQAGRGAELVFEPQPAP
jgi:hypothetical protein